MFYMYLIMFKPLFAKINLNEFTKVASQKCQDQIAYENNNVSKKIFLKHWQKIFIKR